MTTPFNHERNLVQCHHLIKRCSLDLCAKCL